MASRPSKWGTVWITGASSGIGASLATLIAERSLAESVAASARSTDKLEALSKANPTIKSYPVDVTDAVAVAECVSGIEEESGPIALAVLCAGTWKLTDIEGFDIASARAGIEVNYMGVIHALAAIVPGMMKRRSGHIAIVASVAGYRGLPLSAAYGPTKAALINLAETLRAELRPYGITVSIVNPGFVDTPMTSDNPFPMPGIISAESAAQSLLAGLEAKKYEIIFPRGFGYSVKALRYLPNAVFFWVVRTFIMKKAS